MDGSRPPGVSPGLLVLTVLVGSYFVLFLAAAVRQVDVRLIDYRYLGMDFNDFWTAAGDVLAGRDAYAHPRFVTPPLSSLPFLPLAPLTRPDATLVFLCCNCAALAVGVRWLIASFGLSAPRAAVVVLVCALSSATIFLLERGNLDGLVFLTLCAFVRWNSRSVVGAIALAVSSCLKIYPAIFGLVLVARRRWGTTLIFGGTLLICLLLTPSSDLAFLHNQVTRAHGMRVDENLSGLAVFWLLDDLVFGDVGRSVGFHPLMSAGVVLYAAALAFCLWRDARQADDLGPSDRRLLLASYTVFCVNLPSLVYLYSGVCLFIVLAALEQEDLSVDPARLRGIALLLGLTMLPARAFDLTLGPAWAGALNILPPLGSALLIVEAVRLRGYLRPVAAAGRGPGPARDARESVASRG